MAIGWCEMLAAHARRIHGIVTNSPKPAVLQLAEKLSAGALGTRFALRDVYRREWRLLDTKERAETACQDLIHANWLREVPHGGEYTMVDPVLFKNSIDRFDIATF